MRKHGLRCSLFLEMQKCATFFARRVLPNPDFVAALLYAQSRDVLVLGSDVFLVHDGVVAINIDATDEEIIRFLCGENGCPKK